MKNNNYVVDRSSIYFGILVENKDEIHNFIIKALGIKY